MKKRTLIVESVSGRIVSERIVDGDFVEVVKSVAAEALGKWMPPESDFVIVRYQREAEKKLPLSPSELDAILEFNPVRRSGSVVFDLPMFVISYSNTVVDGDVYDDKVYVVAPYIEGFEDIVRMVAVEATTHGGEE